MPCLPPGDLPDPKTEPKSSPAPALQADFFPLSHQGSPLQTGSNMIKLMYFNQRGDKYRQIIYIGIGGWGRLKEAQTVGTETRLTVKEHSPESAG